MSNEANFYRTKLEELYVIIQRLRPSSSPEEFETFASCFTTDCTVHLKSMNMHNMPGISRDEAIEDMKEVLGKYHIEEREVLFFSLASDGHTVLCETKQRINVMGEIVEPFFETEVVTFDDEGLIKVLKLYSCWSPIVRVVQDKTGRGPYAEGEQREQFEDHVKQVFATKIQNRKARIDAESAHQLQTGLKTDCCT
ncbi:hypothetical protein K505DRAFT_249273 [Melanomma pulvis-pyrius CBS 109.77]|uniref:SnoaL-like domain-containing protein n=1 Tax=Melanomma pulvis-pyrius CBS 109.77 TaxID=1314802 RepID=A0A6A6X4N2_9PLEO|nr:hypothetical protein K505DRAFT_249273 [Melanomma pulvis-pyrius CBS 109.77]